MTVTHRQPADATASRPRRGFGMAVRDQRCDRCPASRPGRPRSRSASQAEVHNGAASTGPSAAPRSSGAWRDGDPVGRRQFADIGDVELERGGRLPDVRIAYETWGRSTSARQRHPRRARPDRRQPRLGRGRAGHASPGWWNSLIGTGRTGRPRRVVRRRLQRARRLPGQHRALEPRRGRPGLGQPLPLRHGARPGGRRASLLDAGHPTASPPSSVARWAACAPSSGRSPTPTSRPVHRARLDGLRDG